MIETSFLISAFATLFVIIDPIGMTPIFVALTQGMTPEKRRGIAIRSCVLAIGILFLFGLAGEALLSFLGISMPAFQIAGGLLLFLTALEMLFEFRTKRRNDHGEDHTDDPSVFPLAIPLIAGPGAITAMILLVGSSDGVVLVSAAVFGVLLLVVGMVFLLFLTAGIFERVLGQTGIVVITRLLGMLLAALSVQFVVDGLRGLGLASA